MIHHATSPFFCFMRIRLLLFLATLTMVAACQKDDPAKPISSGSGLILATEVADAKDWFEQNIRASGLGIAATGEWGAGSASGGGHEQGYGNAIPDWKSASGFFYATGQAALRVPVHFKSVAQRWVFRPRGASQSQPQYQVPDPDLLIAKDSIGHFHLEVREFEPAQEYSVLHKGGISLLDYTGYVIFYDWQGHLLRGYQYRAGAVTGIIHPNTGGKGTQSISGATSNKTLDICVTYTEAVYTKFCFYPPCGCTMQMQSMYVRYSAADGPPNLDDGGVVDMMYTCNPWVCEYSSSYELCQPSSPGGPGYDPGPGPGTGPGGSGTGGTGNPGTGTSPDPNSPCGQMATLTTQAGFQTANASAIAMTQGSIERGYVFRNGGNTNTDFEPLINGNANSADWPRLAGWQYDGMIHTHPGGLSVFSMSDLQTIYEVAAEGYMHDPATFTMMVYTSYGDDYAIKITDYNSFLNFAPKIADEYSVGAFEYRYITRRPPLYPFVDSSSLMNEQSLLRILRDFNTGLTLLKHDRTNNTWQPRVLDSNNSPVNNPCQ